MARRGTDPTSPTSPSASGWASSTRFRYFPNKAAILWAREELHTQRFEAHLAEQPADLGVVEGAFAAYAQVYGDAPEWAPLARTMIRILETAPPETTGKWSTYAAWGEITVAYVRRRVGDALPELESRALGLMIWSAMWVALAAWALGDDPSPEPHLQRAQALLAGVEAQLAGRWPPGGLAERPRAY